MRYQVKVIYKGFDTFEVEANNENDAVVMAQAIASVTKLGDLMTTFKDSEVKEL